MSEKTEGDDMLQFEGKKKKKTKLPMAVNVENVPQSEDALVFGKKKKKVQPVLPDDNANIEKATSQKPILPESKVKHKTMKDEKDVDELADQLDGELFFTSKKKKSKKKTLLPDDADKGDAVENKVDVSTKELTDSSGYTYDMLLTRVFTQMGAFNPELVSDQKRRLVMLPPDLARVGSKKTLFVNFATICRSLNREQPHLTTYVLAELGTQGSTDAYGALLIRGRYQSKHIEPVLRNYCRNYVLCGTCQSSETDLCKDSRLLFLHCRRCGSRATVKSVTSGFQAVTGKRAALRAKTQ